jgi:HEAT repeat protein
MGVTVSDRDLPVSGTGSLDTTALNHLVVELNIARRQLAAYPKGHPVIAAATGKVLMCLEKVLGARDEIALGVAKDRLMAGTEVLERGNPVFRDFARILFERGVALLTLYKGLTGPELEQFNEILAWKRERVHEAGGMAQLLAEHGVSHIQVKGIDYSLFRVTTEDWEETDEFADEQEYDGDLWERFVVGLTEGTLDPYSDHPSPDSINPEALALIVSTKKSWDEAETADTYEHAISSLFRGIEQTGGASKYSVESVDKLGRFISSLNPALRRQFLQRSFRTLASHGAIAQNVLSSLSDDVIMEALQESSQSESYVPPMVLDLLQKLAASGAGKRQGKLQELIGSASDEELARKFRVIFQEDELDKFIPEEYQQTLRTIIASDGLTANDECELIELKETLLGHSVETQVSAIILEMMNAPTEDWLREALGRNISELCQYFLDSGDFTTLLSLYEKITGSPEAAGAFKPGTRDEILDVFGRPEFAEEVVLGPVVWGKAKFEEIRCFILRVGEPFVEPLYNRLAEEESISLRRFYMDLLIEMGEAARDAALLRLGDSRWYFVRNLLIILRVLDAPMVAPHLHRLIGNQHPKLQQELLKTLLHFQDPEGERLLAQDLGSTSDEVRLNAIQISGRSRNPAVLKYLIDVVSSGGLSTAEFEMKKAAIYSLAEIGDSRALPCLETVLKGRSLFSSATLNRLKAEAVRTLDRYASPDAGRMLRQIAAGGNQELARLASELLRGMQGRGQ